MAFHGDFTPPFNHAAQFALISTETNARRDATAQSLRGHHRFICEGCMALRSSLQEVSHSVSVILANPQDVKARKGHKTDPKDSWWLAHLLRHAMIRPSFIPPQAIRELRDLTRRRKQLLHHGTSERNRVQKVLEDANIKLGSVLSDVFGASGQLMLNALLEGKATPEEIAQFAKAAPSRRFQNCLPRSM